MGWYEDVDEIRTDIAELSNFLDTQPGLTASTRVNAMSAMVSAKAMILMVETFEQRREGLEADTLRPLAHALARFPEAASQLASGLQRLPER